MSDVKVNLKIPRSMRHKKEYAEIGMHFRCTVEENDVYVLTCCNGTWYCINISNGQDVEIECDDDTPTIREVEDCHNERLLVRTITVE